MSDYLSNSVELSNKGYKNIEFIDMFELIVACDISGDIHFFDNQLVEDLNNGIEIKKVSDKEYELAKGNYSFSYTID